MRIKSIDISVYSLVAVFLSALFLYMPELVTESITRSLSLCATRVIPAVFPFSVLSSFFIYSGGVDILDRILKRPFYRLFGLRSGASAFLCGLIFGFPLGAMTSGSLYRNGALTETECERLLCFGCCASPTFPVFAVGRGMFGSVGIGLLLWALQALAAVIIGIISKFVFPKSPAIKAAPTAKQKNVRSLPEMLTASVADASRVMLSVCGAVTFFSLIAAVTSSLLSQVFDSVYCRLSVSILFEFATGCAASAEAYTAGEIGREAAIAFSGFAIGFSGASVICQNASVLPRGTIKLRPHIISKLITGLLTASASYFLSSFIPASVSVSFTPAYTSISPLFILPSLLFFCVFALIKRDTEK